MVGEIITPLADDIAELITPIEEIEEGEEGEEEEEGEIIFNYAALVELLGEDIAEMLGEQIAGALPGDIANILTEFIAQLVEAKMQNSVVATVDAAVNELVAQQIEEPKIAAADIELIVYAYQEEGE